MFHVVKKHVSRAKQPLFSAPNAEFADYKQRLISIRQSLKYTSSMLTSANRGWIIQMQQQRLFSERFHESYPTTFDDVYQVAQQFAAGSQNLYDKFTRENSEDLETFRKIHHQVLVYIKEIETLEKTYSKLASAKSEASRYQAKLDAMERSRRPIDASKKSRNLQKMDRYKEQYKKLVQNVIEQQKRTYAKHPIVFKAALTSYWLNHEKHVNMLVESLEATQQFARLHEEHMRELDIATYEPDMDILIPNARSLNHIRNLSSKVSSSSSEPDTTGQNIMAPSDARAVNLNVNAKSTAPPTSPVSQPSPSSAGPSPMTAQVPENGVISGTSKGKPSPTISNSVNGVVSDAEDTARFEKAIAA